MRLIGRFVSKTQFWNDVAWRLALCGIDADQIWEMTLADYCKALRERWA